jgi:hypothetical protein
MKNITTTIVFIFAIFTFASAQTNSVKLSSAKQVLPLLMNDLSQESSYIDGMVKLGYYTIGINTNGENIYTNNDGDNIVYGVPVKDHDANGNEIIRCSMRYFSKETEDLDAVLSYLDSYNNSELYNGYGLETDDSHDEEFYFSKSKSSILKYLKNGEYITFDKAKYYIKERADKNTLERGIQLVNKLEGVVEKSFYMAFVNIKQETYYQTSQVSQASEEDPSEEYKEAEFQGEEEIEYTLSKPEEPTYESVKESKSNTKSEKRKLAPAMKGVAITEKSMIGKWRASNGTVFNFMYGKVEVYPPNSQMIDAQTIYKGNGVIWLSAWGMLITQLQVISKTPSKMVLYDMETGRKINFSKY